MENILNSIETSLQTKNWYAALMLSLVIPDICPKLEGDTRGSTARYPEWFNNHLGTKYRGYMSGNDCYALRCAYLHEGSDSVELQRSRDVLEHFVFHCEGAHLVRTSNIIFGSSKHDQKEVLVLSVNDFCEDMISATREWLKDVEDNETIQKYLNEMIVINEKEFSLGVFRIG